MLKKRTKVLCIILAGVLVLLTLTGAVTYFFKIRGQKNFTLLNAPLSGENYVSFKSDVKIAEDSSGIQENLISVKYEKSKYIFTYKNSVPTFFNNMKANDVFYVCPDEKAEKSYFAFGFCGKITSITNKEQNSKVVFKIPELSNVFSEMKIRTDTANTAISSMSFIPENSFYISNADNAPLPLHTGHFKNIDKANIGASIESGNKTYSFTYKNADKQSNLKDYLLLCKSLTLKIKNKDLSENIAETAVSGSITLDYPAVKFCIDYKRDKNNKVKVNQYDFGFITKQKINIKIQNGQSIGLDDLTKQQENHILDIIDVTKAERKKGKIVLGTYLIGIEASIPQLENKANKVNSISLGIAVQLTMTAKGELNLEYNIDESGFLRSEINSEGKKLCQIKSYDYPNPVVDNPEINTEIIDDKPKVTSSISGEAKINLAAGCDLGFCVMGMVPMKFTNNLMDIDMSRSFYVNLTEDETNKSQTLTENNYLLDDNLDYYNVSSNTYFKLNIGTNVNLGIYKKNYSAGGSVLLRKDIIFQYPNPIGFSHSECCFGGIMLGKTYSDDELTDTVKQFLKDTGQHNIITEAKQSVIGSIINGALSSFGSQLSGLSQRFDGKIKNCKMDYFTSGIIYLRNENNVVVAEIIVGDNVFNSSGFHTGLSSRKTEQIYSAPLTGLTVDFELGTIAKLILGMNDIDNTSVTRNIYKSKDSNDVMEVLIDNNCDCVKMIILS